MELYIYNTDLLMLGIIDEISSLIWTRRYWEAGEFSLLVPVTARHNMLLQPGSLVVRKDSDEAGLIRYAHINKDENGLEQIEVHGFFLSCWIGQRILQSRFVMQAPSDEVLRTLVRDNLVAPTDARRKFERLVIDETPLPDIATLRISADALQNTLEVCSDRAKLAKIGFKIVTDIRARQHIFRVYKGRDRSSTQKRHSICIFSPDFDNILSQEYILSHENLATAVYVVGEAAQQGQEPMVVEVDDGLSTGHRRIEFLYEGTDGLTRSYMVDGEQQTIPDDAYREILQTRGLSVLDQKAERLSFSSFINTHANLKYKRDFDLGDIVTCLNQRWRLRIDSRITEVTESYENGQENLEMTFGVSIPSLHEVLKWR